MYKSASKFFQSFKERNGRDPFSTAKSSGTKSTKKKPKRPTPKPITVRSQEKSHLEDQLEISKGKEKRLRAELNKANVALKIQKDVNSQMRAALESAKNKNQKLQELVTSFQPERGKLLKALNDERATNEGLRKHIKSLVLGKAK